MMVGRNYQSYLRSDPEFGEFAQFAYPNDGSWVIDLRTFNQTPYLLLAYDSNHCHKTNYHYVYGMTGKTMSTHIAIALLWGAENNSGVHIPPGTNLCALGLVVDHIQEGNVRNWRKDNVQFLTLAQNVSKRRPPTISLPKMGKWLDPQPVSMEDQNFDYLFANITKGSDGYVVRKKELNIPTIRRRYSTELEAEKAMFALNVQLFWLKVELQNELAEKVRAVDEKLVWLRSRVMIVLMTA